MAQAHAPGFLKLVSDARSRIRECTIEEMRSRLASGDKFILIDVREESEWSAGHIPGAIHLGKGVIERDIEAKIPDPATPIVVYCGVDFDRLLPPTTFKRWATRRSFRWTAACEAGVNGAFRLRSKPRRG